MPDQAAHLRHLVRTAVDLDAALAPGAPIVAISGARPTLGATTAAYGLATQLARLGKQTILIDANLQRPAIAQYLKSSGPFPLEERAGEGGGSGARTPFKTTSYTATLTDVLNGNRRAIETLVDVSENLRLLPAHPNAIPTLDPQSYQRFAAEIAALSRQCDVLLIDAGSGMSAWIDRLWQLAHQVLLITAPDSAAMVDAYAAVKLSQFHRLDARLRLVFNRCADDAEAAPWSARFNDTCARFLFITPKPPATLAEYNRAGGAASKSVGAQKNVGGVSDADSPYHPYKDTPFTRSARLLAADLIADARTARIPHPFSRDPTGERASNRFLAGLTPDS